MTTDSEMASRMIAVRITPSEFAALREAADTDERTVSALARRILAHWLKSQGFIQESNGEDQGI